MRSRACEHAFAIDPTATVEMRLDSKLVVEQMSGRWQVKHPDMRVLAKRARDAFPPGQVTYTWVPRERNKLADALVNEMIDGALARGEARIARLDGAPAEDALAEDVVGSIDVERSRAVVGEQEAAATAPQRPRGMGGPRACRRSPCWLATVPPR